MGEVAMHLVRSFRLLLIVAASFLQCATVLVAGIPEGRTTEAEAQGVAIGGALLQDPDASFTAVSITSMGHYTWWNVPTSGLPTGRFTLHVRARSMDGAAHIFGEHIAVNSVEVAAFNASITSKAHKWYQLG